jgi:signal transduction histidine kinase/CheY-like chemotaxis protein
MKAAVGPSFDGVARFHANSMALEQTQTTKRLIISNIVIIYMVVMGVDISPSITLEPWVDRVLIYYALHITAGLILFWAARRQSHPSPARRIAGMIADYGFLGLAISCQPIILMPLYTVIIWVTLGNGLRFGRPYLFIATAFAVFTVVAVAVVTFEDEVAIYVSSMVIMAVLAVPQYAASLLSGVEAARAEADAANIAKSRFLAQASHDLRQPIHAISLFLASLQQTGLQPAQQLIVDRIDRSLQGVARLFRSLLDLSTLDSGSVQVRIVPVPLADMLSELVQQNMQLAEQQQCTITLVNVDHIVRADRNLLMTMVQNLLSNALKFAAGRKVLIGCRKQGATLSLQLWDQGPGIEEAHLSRIFEEFYQVKGLGDKDQQGVGLGLTIVARMAGLMGLAVQARSAPGKGSCFAVTGLHILPAAGLPLPSPGGTAPTSPISGMRILLVEDDPDILAATTELISKWGCMVTAMTSIPASLEHDYDLIIVDFDLGNGVTGSDCLKAVRELKGSDLPAIILTAHEESRVLQEIRLPNMLILKKPLRPAELRSAIGAARIS